MLERYVREFVERYKDHKAVLFYEVSNELNLTVDLDVASRLSVTRHVARKLRPHQRR